MKQLLFLFLFLFPCLALAQYTGNAGQKISLGEQTTADGLVYRGVASIDTVTATSKITRANKQDTSAFLLLDTVTNLLWHYKTASNGWLQAGGSTFDTTTLNLVSRFAAKQNTLTLTTTGTSGAATLTGATLNIPQYSGGGGISDGDKGDIDVTNSGATWTIDTSAISLSGNKVTGTLPVANGGTNAGAFTSGSVVFAGASGTYTQDNSNLFWNNSTKRLGLGTNTPSETFHASGGAPAFRFSSTTYGDGDTYIGNTGQYGTYIGDGRSISGNFTGQAATIKRHAVVFGFGGSFTESFYVVNYPSGILTYRLVLDTTGKLGIGIRYPTEKLHVVGNARISAMSGINDIGADANGVLQAATSDMNLKNTIENSPFGLNEILLLNPVTFLYNDENRKIDSDVKEVGFIAQDVFDIIPNAVSSTGTGDLQLDYRAITATLVKAIQEQQALIKALEQRILILENK